MAFGRQAILISWRITIILNCPEVLQDFTTGSWFLRWVHIREPSLALARWNSLATWRLLLLESTCAYLGAPILNSRLKRWLFVLGILVHVLLFTLIMVRRHVASLVSRQLFIRAMVVQFYLLTREAVINTHIRLIIEAPQLRGPVSILLIVARRSTRRSDTLSSNQRREHLLLSGISLHLSHYIVMILFV